MMKIHLSLQATMGERARLNILYYGVLILYFCDCIMLIFKALEKEMKQRKDISTFFSLVYGLQLYSLFIFCRSLVH